MGDDYGEYQWKFFISCIAGASAAFCMMVVTYLASKLEYIPAGVFGGIPAAIIPISFAFITSHDVPIATKALFSVPCGILMDSIFLLVWRTLPRLFAALQYRYSHFISINPIIAITVFISVSVWMAAATGLVFILDLLQDHLLWISIGCIILLFAIGVIMTMIQPLPPAYNQLSVAHPLFYLATCVLSFCFVSSSVLLSHEHAISAGVLASFPDFFLICVISYWWSAAHSTTEVKMDTSKSTLYIGNMLLGVLSNCAYCVIFATLYTEEFAYWDEDQFYFAAFICASTSFTISFFFFSVPVIVILRLIQLGAENSLPPVVIAFGTPFHTRHRSPLSNQQQQQQQQQQKLKEKHQIFNVLEDSPPDSQNTSPNHIENLGNNNNNNNNFKTPKISSTSNAVARPLIFDIEKQGNYGTSSKNHSSRSSSFIADSDDSEGSSNYLSSASNKKLSATDDIKSNSTTPTIKSSRQTPQNNNNNNRNNNNNKNNESDTEEYSLISD